MISSTQGSDSVTSEAPILASAAETSNPIPTATQEGAAGAASGHPAAKGDGSIPKILVVDDDTGQRLMLKAVNDAFFGAAAAFMECLAIAFL